jgi:hypothetical protein
MSKTPNSRVDKYNKEIKEGNVNFTSKLRQKMQDDMYEESSLSNSQDTSTPKSDVDMEDDEVVQRDFLKG